MLKKFKKNYQIRVLFIDVDGTFTDGGIILDDQGREFKRFCARDGLGIALAQKAGIEVVIITGRCSKVVELRARELSINEVHQGIRHKGPLVEELQEKFRVNSEDCAFIGDDLNDISGMKKCGLTFAPADANEYIREMVDHVMTRPAGYGAIREAVDLILKNTGQLKLIIDKYFQC